MAKSLAWFLLYCSMYYPQILVFVASSFALCFLFSRMLPCTHLRVKATRISWRALGELIANVHSLPDYATRNLRRHKRTLAFRGPPLSGLEFVVTCDPENVRHILDFNFSNYNKGDDFHEIFDMLGDGIFNADSESWKSQRKMALRHLSHPEFRSLLVATTRDKARKKLLPFLSLTVQSDEAFDLQDVAMRFMFDVTCVLVFGVDTGCLAPDLPSIPFAEAAGDAARVVLHRHLLPRFWWKTMRWLRVAGEKRMAMATDVVNSFVARVIARRREAKESYDPTGSQRDLLTSYMMDASLDDKFLRDTLLTFLLAGRDTTGAAIAWFFWFVATHPNVEAKILDELRHNQGTPDDEPAQQLTYLHAALCETLRLAPPLPWNHKAAVQPDVLPSGHVVRRGTRVIISSYAMGRMEEIWGKDCMEFKPERWIMEDGKLRHEPSYKFLAFNSGPRTCLGKDTAFTQMKVVAAAVLANFCIEPVKGHRVVPKLSIVFAMKNGLMVKLKKRISE